MSIFLNMCFFLFPRHCEERSDAAIQPHAKQSGLLRFARNDEAPVDDQDFYDHFASIFQSYHRGLCHRYLCQSYIYIRIRSR
jgi:hypothetical protein